MNIPDRPQRGKWIVSRETGKLEPYTEPPKREVNAPSVIVDDMEPTWHPCNGRYYTSKSEFRRITKMYDCEEIGTEIDWRPPNYEKEKKAKQEKETEEEIAKAYHAIRDNMAPLSELDKARCKIMDRNLEHYNYDNRERDEHGNIRE